MDKILRTRGALGLIRWVKPIRLALLHYLSGESSSKRVPGVKLDDKGYPKALGIAAEALSPGLIRYVLTILFSTRALALGKKPDLGPIQDPPKVEAFPVFPDPSNFWAAIGYRRAKTSPRSLHFNGKFHLSTKAGPNGPALWTSLTDLLYLKDSDIYQDVRTLGGPRLQHAMDRILKLWDVIPHFLRSEGKDRLRKLSFFADTEEKVRVVAQLDYFSQTALRGLHNYLFDVLRRIPQDMTFNQGGFTEVVKGWKSYDSIDLTAATDRFPIHLISHTLRGVLPESYVTAWERVMVHLPFKFGDSDVKYAIGNPMGAYSSWNSFTVAHHFVMWWACQETGIQWSKAPYAILGDDLVIGDHLLAMAYKRIMAALGVDINLIKSHSSDKLLEFAKRLILNGVEITPFPISALAETSKKFYLLVNLMLEERRKGWVWTTGISPSIRDFYRTVFTYNATKSKIVEERSFRTELMMLYMRGAVTADGLISQFIGRYAAPNTRSGNLTSPRGALMVFSEILSYFLLEENPFGTLPSRMEFNVLATQIGLAIGASAEEIGLTDAHESLMTNIPLTNVIRQVMSKIIDLTQQEPNPRKPSDLFKTLKLLSLPISDKIFTEKEKYTVSRSASVLAERLFQRLAQAVTFRIAVSRKVGTGKRNSVPSDS